MQSRPSLSTRSGLRVGAAILALSLGLGGVAGTLHSAQAEPVRVEGVQQQGFGDVVEKVAPAVVSVRVKARVENVSDRGSRGLPGMPGFDNFPDDHPLKRFFDEFGPRGERDNRDAQRGDRGDRRGPIRPVSQGSGFFISDDGFIVTNNHVVEGGAEFTVVLDDGTELDAKLVGTDPRTDVALLKTDANREFTYVQFADDKGVRVGDWVVAVGNPFGLGGTVTAGIVSGLGRDIGAGPYSDFIQIDAAVNRGNSGGPAFNLNGEVIGINTAIFSPSGGNVGIAFAIQASTAKAVIEDLKDDGKVTRGYIGVRIQPLNDDIANSLGLEKPEGALVASVEPDGPAGAAGIKPGDVILGVNDNPVANPRELSRRIAGINPGSAAKLKVYRSGKEQTISLNLGELQAARADAPQVEAEPSAPASLSQFGLEVLPNDKGDGIVVTSVDPDGVAAEKGLAPGDVIAEINGKAVNSADDFLAALDEAEGANRNAILLQVQREDFTRFLALPIDKG